MVKDIVALKLLLRIAKISIHLERLLLVCTIIKTVILRNRLMKLKGSFMSMPVPHAGHGMVSLTPTHRLNVIRVVSLNHVH